MPGTPDGAQTSVEDSALDYRAGLARLMGDQAMYLRVLTRFHLDYRGMVLGLHDALAAGDLLLAQRLAHTLKGAAAMIEARRLRQLAHQVEHGMRAGSGVDPQLLACLGRELERVMAELDLLLEQPAELAQAVATRVFAEADMTHLCELLDTGDSAAQDFVEDQFAGLRIVLGMKRAAELQAAMAAFDFDKALQLLRPDAHAGRDLLTSG
ncbi:Hpt domain-containing protein [Massilia sp. H6]|uniref:Hpt domain-containing protein n=1 Tax=Massilia sp. H6 TaxID=2970464 RepID=UPI00216A90F9|nr:Hpt domain-containing protein [Massilia sp. H6]UVW28562.1 Hpt domain-containing protein [Massilia sp. H6]